MLLSTCGFSAAVDPVLRSVLADICTQYDSGAKLFAYLDDWQLWIKPQYLLQTVAIITVVTRSVNLALQVTKTQVWRASCQDPSPPEFQDKVALTLSCLGGHLQIHGDIEPSPVVLGEQVNMGKTTQRFQRIATTLADLNAEGLNAQAVNDLLTMYVGAGSQHVLRMSFVPEQRGSQLRPTGYDLLVPPCATRCHLSVVSDLEWALQSSATLLHHVARGSQSFPPSWQQPGHQTQIPSSTQHHDSEPNKRNSKPHFHYK